MNEIKIVLIEDHKLTRIGLRAAFQTDPEIKIVGEAANGREGLTLLEMTKPDVAIVDIGMPEMDGIELSQKFRQFQAQNDDDSTKILILTMRGTEESVLAAFAAGADSYCMKDIETESLLQAVKQTHEGHSWIDPAIASLVVQKIRVELPDGSGTQQKTVAINAIEPEYEQVMKTYPLTERELEILELIVAGDSNALIAEKLYVTIGTVKTHVRSILSKLCVDDRTQAAVRALRSGLVC
ncbi:MAG: response regulator transcription factor [Cyanosarcina radialis HA8281-LM2]|jgi:DNA-binding NarL/FixJ family response regulator|nr:response regulator transcription factor [Cyanosarcina radialis HA8281-LM2]